MASIVWPAGLPQRPLLASLRESFPTIAIRSQPDSGPPKARRRFTAGVRPWHVELSLSRDQVALLDEFHQSTTAGGSLPFEWVHFRTLAPAMMMFAGEPSADPRSPIASGSEPWHVSFDVLMLPQPPEASAPTPPDDDAAVVQSLLDDLDEMADGGDDEADDSMSIDPEFVGGVEIEPDNFATASP